MLAELLQTKSLTDATQRRAPTPAMHSTGRQRAGGSRYLLDPGARRIEILAEAVLARRGHWGVGSAPSAGLQGIGLGRLRASRRMAREAGDMFGEMLVVAE